MNSAHFSEELRDIIRRSYSAAVEHGSLHIDTEHLLIASLEADNTHIRDGLKKVHADPLKLKADLSGSIQDRGNKVEGNIPLTDDAEQVMHGLQQEAEALNVPMYDARHIFLAILRNEQLSGTELLHRYNVHYPMLFDSFTAGDR